MKTSTLSKLVILSHIIGWPLIFFVPDYLQIGIGCYLGSSLPGLIVILSNWELMMYD